MAIQALVMGFGGTGAHILTYVKEQAVLKYGTEEGSVRFLLFDTIADWRPGRTVKIAGGAGEETVAQGVETSLDPNQEYFFLGDRDPSLRKHVYEILGPDGYYDNYPHLRHWLHTPWLRDNVEKAQMEIVVGAAQQRQIGRFAIFQNAQKIVDQIHRELRELRDKAKGGPVNVWIVSSSAGGTGAGCFLDAAHLTRIAAGDMEVGITGVIVLPEVYDDKAGISRGRAYALFRELDRFQLQGTTDRDRYLQSGRACASMVLYDARDQLRSVVPSKLFDNFFYVGAQCRSDEERTAFFTSVASSIDPFLDVNAGPQLLEKSVNLDASASAFGAARLYIPKETLGELFAWKQVDGYLRRACALEESDGRRRLASGAVREREEEARKKVRELSPLFSKVLELEGTDEALGRFARTLQPQEIVEEWYGTSAPQVIGLDLRPEEVRDLELTYAAPAYSFREPEPDRVSAAERTIKTYSEHRASVRELNLPRENAEESRARFVRELESLMKSYKDADAPARSFERGRRLLLSKLSDHLSHKVDRMIFETLEKSDRFASDEEAPEQGTALTRLYQVLREMLADDGPFRQIDRRVALFLDALGGEEEQREHEAVQAVHDLSEWKSRLFGGSVDEPQVAARESVSQYMKVFQRDRLLADLQRLVREVRQRIEEWEALLRSAFDTLVIDPANSCWADTGSQVRRLENRLARLARNPKARISVDPNWSPERPGEDMLGFREHLAARCAVDQDNKPLASSVLRQSAWKLDLDSTGRPNLALELRLPDSGEETLGKTDLAQVHQLLYHSFRSLIDRELGVVDIFDYLAWAEREQRITAESIARTLNESARPLIIAEGPETCHLVVHSPSDKDKERWISSLNEALRAALGVAKLERVTYSDHDSISVFRIVKPKNLDDFRNVVECQQHYVEMQQMEVAEDAAARAELRRAQVYHAFRPEMEAWYIERRSFQLRQRQLRPDDHLTPRLVRLLEEPAMMQAFVECVGTGAVEKAEDGDWVWHATSEDIPLTVDQPTSDLLRAATIFVLQKQEGRQGGLRRIELEAARKSARERAQADGKTLSEALERFLESSLEGLLTSLQPPEHGDGKREKDGLKMLFEFYADPKTRTTLGHRQALRHVAV